MKVMTGLKDAVRRGTCFGIKGATHVQYGTAIYYACLRRATRLSKPKWMHKADQQRKRV